MLIDTVARGPKLQLYNSILMYYDSTRSKWLSTSRDSTKFGLSNSNIRTNRWMAIVGGSYSNVTGVKIPRDATITAITAQTQNTTTCEFRIRVNGLAPDVYVLSLSAQDSLSVDSLNIDLDADDWIQCELTTLTANPVDYPEVYLEFCWRKTV